MMPRQLNWILQIMTDLTDRTDFTPYRKLDEIPVELWEGFVFDIREEFGQPELLIDPAWTAYDLHQAIYEAEYGTARGRSR